MRTREWLGRVGFGGGWSRWRVARVSGVFAFVCFSLALASVADASTNFTWSGKAGEGVPKWSAGENWESKIAPGSGAMVGTLSFPALTGVPCTFKTPNEGCGYGSKNDISGVSVESMSIDDGEDYSIVGEPITLGSGGLSASPAAVTSKLTLSELDLPVMLGASQTWSIGGEGLGHLLENDLYVGGNLTGSGSALTVNMSGGPALYLENETEVGPVAIDGANASEPGIFNGTVELFGGTLNSSDGNPVSLSHVFSIGTGAVGPLTTASAELVVGSGTYPAEGIEARSLKLDSASHIGFEISGAGATAQKDYSQLTALGAIELGNAMFEVVVRPAKRGEPCPVLTRGQTYTFLSTTGMLSGSFSNAPEGGSEIPIRFAEACRQISQTMRISYHESGGTQTVTGTVEAEAKEKQEAKERQEKEAKEKEAKEQEARNEETRKRLVEEHAKQVGEEAAAKEAAAKKHEEETTAAVTRKHQEEAAVIAAGKRQEEEATTRQREEEKAKPKPLSRAQLLAKTLKTCKRQPKRKRAKCEATAKKKYGNSARGRKGKKR